MILKSNTKKAYAANVFWRISSSLMRFKGEKKNFNKRVESVGIGNGRKKFLKKIYNVFIPRKFYVNFSCYMRESRGKNV